MKDNFKKLIDSLPEEKSNKDEADLVAAKIIRKNLVYFWEKRLSFVSGICSIFFGVLSIKETVEMMDVLGTIGFWSLVGSDREWLIQEWPVVWSAFCEAHPLKECAMVLILVLLFILSLCVFLREEKWV